MVPMNISSFDGVLFLAHIEYLGVCGGPVCGGERKNQRRNVCKFCVKELRGFSGAREETAFTRDFVENAHDFRSLKARCHGYVIRIYDRRSALMLRACHNNSVIIVIVVHRRRRSAPVVV